ncbi:MAG TPA: hypothetical protein GX506_07035 [Firmicutes bacterium]|nr:hypothetical protein [Bacillota bacterium]
MPRVITNDELTLIAALRPFVGPKAQQLIDTFLDIANRQIEATGQRELSTADMLQEVTGLMKQQLESFATLAVISGVLMFPELIPAAPPAQQDARKTPEIMPEPPEIDMPADLDQGSTSMGELQ